MLAEGDLRLEKAKRPESWVVAVICFLFPPLDTTSTTIKPAACWQEAASLPVVSKPQPQREIVPAVQVVRP